MAKEEKYFSENNFDIVYQYIKNKFESEGTTSFKYNNCNIQLEEANNKTIVIRCISKILITKEGIMGTAMSRSDNERQVAMGNRLFCELLKKATNE